SAHTLAPNHVSAPAAAQTSSMPPKLGTARLTSDGCTKIDAPTIVPTTIAVACGSPIDRVKARMRRSILRQERPDGRQRVGLVRTLVGPVAFHARKAQRHAARILRTGLDVVERDLDHQLRPHEHGGLVSRDFELEQRLR